MTAQVLHFPRTKKRGAKVRTGPRADVLAFPVVQRAELWKRWFWLKRFGDDWSVEEMGDLDEAVPADSRDGERARRMGEVLGDVARREVPDLEARLRKRSNVKDWLERLGVDWEVARTAEDALFFTYDRFAGPTPPSSA